jgi:hypothetical protein
VQLWEILAEVLGDEPTDRSVWLATRREKDSRKLCLDVIHKYRSVELEPLPAKSPRTFRPAFMLDFYGQSQTPYDREFNFIARCMSYADQVAVVDEVGTWSAQDDPEAYLDEVMFGGFPECDNQTWALRRIIKYSALERAQLLYYIDAPQRPDEETIRATTATRAFDDLSSLVAERHGYVQSATEKSYGRELIVHDLGLWFQHMQAILDHTEKLHQNIDLYLPEWFAGPELLDWLYQQQLPPEWLDNSTLQNQKGIVDLLSLPAPSTELVQRLGANDLIDVRRADHMYEWREAFRSQAAHMTLEADLTTRVDAYRSLQDSAEQLAKAEKRFPALRFGLKGSIQAGLAVLPVAAVTHAEPATAAVEALAPTAANITYSFLRWAGSRRRGDLELDVRSSGDESVAVRAFINEPRPVDGNRGRPPNSMMRTLDGRPIAFDLFDGFLG